MDPEPTENQNDIPNNVNYARLIEDENEFVYIRESNSAPLDSPPIQKSNVANAQCGNFMILLPLTFYMKSILVIFKATKLSF